MGRGIKKISENVIADKRSLTLVTCSSSAVPRTQLVKSPTDIVDTEAMPIGMLNVDYGSMGLSIKIDQNKWSKLDARNTLADGSVMSETIGNGQVKSANIGENAVVTSKISNNAVTTPKIANSAVTTIKIADANVTNSKLAIDSVTTDKIKYANVTIDKLAHNSVNRDKIIDGEIVTSKIANRSVTTEKIADNAVTCNQISMTGDNRIATSNLQDSVITNAKLANGSVNAVKIATSGVATHNYQDYSVTEQKLASSAVTTPKIKNQAVTKEKIAPGAVDLECLGPNISDIINRAVVHDGQGNVTGEGKSTILNDITATGDIYARRVYNVVYMDIAEGYIPGEDLESGDIVAMHEDGMVYKANSIHDCIVGVVSNEYAHCLGASREELFSGEKVAVGMIGKIHVKVKGPVRLGQRIDISLSEPGVGIGSWMNGCKNVGQILESVDCDFDEIHTVLVQVRPM